MKIQPPASCDRTRRWRRGRCHELSRHPPVASGISARSRPVVLCVSSHPRDMRGDRKPAPAMLGPYVGVAAATRAAILFREHRTGMNDREIAYQPDDDVLGADV